MSGVTVTLATFPLPDRDEPYWQVSLNGLPVIPETLSQTDATAAFERTCASVNARARRTFWDGYNAQETVL